MPTNILMPALSPTMEQGKIARWMKKEGDTIKSGDILAEIETDKATMEVEAVDEGVLAKILVPDGSDNVAVNTPIGVIAGEGEDASAAAAPAAAPAPKAAPPTVPAEAKAPTSAAPACNVGAATSTLSGFVAAGFGESTGADAAWVVAAGRDVTTPPNVAGVGAKLCAKAANVRRLPVLVAFAGWCNRIAPQVFLARPAALLPPGACVRRPVAAKPKIHRGSIEAGSRPADRNARDQR